MEMEGRGYSDLYRNTSEEMFIRTMMDSSIGMPAPTMEMLGFKNLNQSSRIDSEELFKNWLTNGENNGGFSHRNRQGSRSVMSRISAEASNLSNQQSGVPLQKKKSDDILFAQNTVMMGDSSVDVLNHHNSRNPVDKNLQATNMFLAKAWFHSSQPMTRSRSSELRRRYVASQIPHPVHTVMETLPNISENGIISSSSFKQEEYNHPNENGYNSTVSMCEPSQMNTFLSPSNSSSSNFNAPQMANMDNISSVVSMLKGTLERKKLSSLGEKEALEDTYFAYCGSEDALGQENQTYDQMQGTFQDLSAIQVAEGGGALQTAEMSYGIMVSTANVMQMSTLSREPSQSESSAAANGFEVCDGQSTSGQAPSVCESSGKQVGNGRTSEYGSRVKDARQRTYENGKDGRKKGGLVRYGSINSAGSGEQGDPTKKRRVERSRKMAEAKERNSTPVVPSDMQSILKRCENLEKEVRSLKLNLSFMNRKDSEQTKQIEELQKQNEDLSKEKERLLEEIERIISETANM